MPERVRLFLIFIAAVFLRWCVTYHPYSGEGKPPMYGDYEAQRHWQEITFNLPPKEWYANSTNNDLQYWGLDYPPLTAYHSLLLAYVADKIDPEFVRLGDSRGFESESHRLFMRLSVILVDILIYLPAVYLFVSKVKIAKAEEPEEKELNIFRFRRRDFVLISIVIYPGLVLIDHGHFQYNCVSLGFFVAAVTAIIQNMSLTGSCLFVLALNYKQMELYHSLPFFFHILGNNVKYDKGSLTIRFGKLLSVASIVLITFSVIWSPFLTDLDTLYNIIVRLFPLARGIFEDKVANFWCALNVLYKLRDQFSNVELAKICLVVTLASALPSNLNLFLKPTNEKFILSLINTSLAFFLFSFQVHEKSILLVAIPVLLYANQDPLACHWFLVISNFSMLPLYVKDNLLTAYVALTTFYVISIFFMFSDIFSISIYQKEKNNTSKAHTAVKSHSKVQGSRLSSVKVKGKAGHWRNWAIGLLSVSMLGSLVLTAGIFLLEPPVKYPDLFPVLISLYSCLHFYLFLLYFNYKQFTLDNVTKKSKTS